MAAGHIKRRESKLTGKVTYQARLPREGNPREHHVQSFDRKKDAERWLAEEQAKRLRGDYIDPRTAATPFRELVATWERTRAAKLAPKTRERYASVTRTHLLPAFGSTPVAKLSRAAIKEWFADLDATPGTARKIQVVLSSILSEGVELGLLRENPAARLRLAAPPRRDMTILTAAEVRAVAEAVGEQGRAQDRLAVYMAAYTGLRAGELWALRRRDVDPSKRTLMVERTLHEAHGRLEFVNATKTDGSRRVVSLPTFLVNMLAEHLTALPSAADALLFTSPDGEPVRHGLFVRRLFKVAVQGRAAQPARRVRNGNGHRPIPARPAVEAALPADKQNVRWHDLRHTCASLLIHSGANILLVQRRLGHSDPAMTLKVYGHLYPSAEAALADALDATYNNVTPIRHEEAA